MNEPIDKSSLVPFPKDRLSPEGSDSGEQGYRLFKKIFSGFLIAFGLGLIYWTGYEQGRGTLFSDDSSFSPDQAIVLNKEDKSKAIDFGLFWRVWDILKNRYVDQESLDAKKMLYGAIDGMLASTGDPYTTFFDPKENESFQEDISGNFEGIGAEMGLKDGVLTIIAPLDDSPAERAGLRAGDKIIRINQDLSSNFSLDEAVSKIRGQKGTEVTLSVFSEGDEETRDITIKRDMIHVKSVKWEMKEGNIAFVRLSIFGEETSGEFDKAVREILAAKPKGLVLDLRNNSGGLLDRAIHIAERMLPKGDVIVIQEDGDGKQDEFRASGDNALRNIPTVILINQGSASASEILAGALRENRDDVRLVGTKSFGKGSVQELVSVGKDAAVKITIARWLTPKKNQIHNVGISPDEEVKLTREDIEKKEDPQLKKAIEMVTKGFETKS